MKKKYLKNTSSFKSIIQQSVAILAYITAYLNKKEPTTLYNKNYIPPIKYTDIKSLFFSHNVEDNTDKFQPYLGIRIHDVSSNDGIEIPASPLLAFTINQIIEFQKYLKDKIKFYRQLALV